MADEVAFLPAALSLQEMPVHPAPRRLAYALMALFTIALAWSSFGKVDIVAVAPGRIVVSERTKQIQPLERSVVKRVLVKDGERVRMGQALVELDPTSEAADKASIQEQLRANVSDVLRSRVLQQALQGSGPRTASFVDLRDHLSKETPPEWTAAEKIATQAQLEAEWSDISAKLAAETYHRQPKWRQREKAWPSWRLPCRWRKREEDVKQLADQGFMSGHAGQRLLETQRR